MCKSAQDSQSLCKALSLHSSFPAHTRKKDWRKVSAIDSKCYPKALAFILPHLWRTGGETIEIFDCFGRVRSDHFGLNQPVSFLGPFGTRFGTMLAAFCLIYAFVPITFESF